MLTSDCSKAKALTMVFRIFVLMLPQPISELSNFESLLLGSVKAGYPAPGGDTPEKLDLVKMLVPNRPSTFFWVVIILWCMFFSGLSATASALTRAWGGRVAERLEENVLCMDVCSDC